MKKILIALLLTLQIFAQEDVVEEQDYAPVGVEPVVEVPVAEASTASTQAATAQSENHWQNWVFAASALVTVTVGVLIISLNKGTTN